MALTSTLYRFHIELSDISRGIYETLDFRVAQHPSEGMPYLLTRVLAYALNIQEGLEFAPTGLGDPDAAAIHIKDTYGGFELLIEIASPSARKLHKATKLAKHVKVYTYKNPETLIDDLRLEKVHKADEIEFFSIAQNFLDELSTKLKRDNRWVVVFDEGSLTVQSGEDSFHTEIHSYTL